jgi:PhnB protein
MTIKAVTPYFMFNGKAEQAIAFYQHALGAKVEMLQRFGDMDPSCPEAMKSRVMHAGLRVGDALLMMSDGANEPTPPGDASVKVALEFDDPDQARHCFDALAAKGQVVQPLIDAPWGGMFGALSDEFGIHWMFNSARAKPA